MLRWLDGLAAHLHTVDLGTWRPDGPYRDTDLDDWPIHLEQDPTHDRPCVVLTGYGGEQVAHGHQVAVQVRVRGGTDPRPSRDRAQAIHDHLHFLTGGAPLPGGLWLVQAPGVNGGAVSLGVDANHRHRHVTNHDIVFEEL